MHFPLGTHMWVNHNLTMFIAVIVVKCVHLKHVEEINEIMMVMLVWEKKPQKVLIHI